MGPTNRQSAMPPDSPTTTLATPDGAPLQAGDQLTRDEFERRYELMPSHVKAELIG